jgi:hypothetical protein
MNLSSTFYVLLKRLLQTGASSRNKLKKKHLFGKFRALFGDVLHFCPSCLIKSIDLVWALITKSEMDGLTTKLHLHRRRSFYDFMKNVGIF